MISVNGVFENDGFSQADIRSVNEKLIKFLSKDRDFTVINFIDGSNVHVEDSIKTLEAKIFALEKEGEQND